tara:strand:+ start:241 stop:624 length:384 start_codon:yes stop_codon:yes gene_type:complete
MTTKNIIKTDTAPKAIGAYSQAVETEKLLFTSGQIPLDPKTGNLVSEDFELQVRQVFNNLESILKSQGLTLNNILKLTVYMVDLNDFDKLNIIFNSVFSCDFPARSVVEVSKLPKNCKVEIDAICFK